MTNTVTGRGYRCGGSTNYHCSSRDSHHLGPASVRVHAILGIYCHHAATYVHACKSFEMLSRNLLSDTGYTDAVENSQSN